MSRGPRRIFVVWLLIAAAALVFAASTIWGMDYYVSPAGSDENPGTAAEPWLTIGHGIGRLQAGYTLHVMAGHYYESNEISGLCGTADMPVTIKGEPGAVVHAAADPRDAFLIWEASAWVIIEDLEITGATRAGIIVNGSSHIIIRNCEIHDNDKWQVQTCRADHVTVEGCTLYGATREHGVYFSTTDFPVARNNVIYDNAGCGVHMNGDLSEGGDGMITAAVVEGNVIYNCGWAGGAGINMDGVEKSLIANNLLYNNHAGGITSFKQDGLSGGTENRFYYNTVCFPPGAGRFALQLLSGSSDATIMNNILVCGDYALEIDAESLPGLVSDHNIFFRHGPSLPIWSEGAKSLETWQSVTGQDANSFEALPDFQDIDSGDFRLQEGSVGVDDGVAIDEVTADLEGVPRPQGSAPDIGAHERVVGRKGDFDGDHDVDADDFSVFIVCYDLDDAAHDWEPNGPIADFDDDGDVDFPDFIEFADVYGT